MADAEQDPSKRTRLDLLAKEVTSILEELVNFAEEKMDDSATILQIIVTSAAEENGEFLVPLSDDRLAALRHSIRIHGDSLDSNFLATAQAWMEKVGREKEMEGMVVILQKVLQIYAAEDILRRGGKGGIAASVGQREAQGGSGGGATVWGSKTPAGRLLDEVLSTDPDKWDGILSGLARSGGGQMGAVTKDGFMGAIQVAIETVILQQENGSMPQRVQAEFLSELCKRVEVACPDNQNPLGL
ncbi:unnamed protein product [Choristocarpus tenellus]